jgi:hypothetical protein
MSHTTLAIYRLPTARATPIGHVRVVLDRHQRIYVHGSRVHATSPSGDFLILTLANEQVYYVKAEDYQRIQAPEPASDKAARATARRRSTRDKK